MTFYDRYCQLCKEKGLKPHSRTTAELIGISNALSVRWKEGILPRSATLEKLSKFFGVSADYLLYGAEHFQPGDALAGDNPELTQVQQFYASNSSFRYLFHAAKDARPEDIELAAKMIEELRKREQ